MPLTRCKHWDVEAFHDFLVANQKAPFVWGSHDCALFAANAIQSYTGVDIADDFRGLYSNQSGAFGLIHAITGGSTVEDAAAWCAAKHGLIEWEYPLCAQRGDLAIVHQSVPNQQDRIVAGVIHLGGDFVTVGESGLLRFPITAVRRSWSV